MTDATVTDDGKTNDTTGAVTALTADGFKPDSAQTPEQQATAKAAHDAAVKAAEDTKAAETAKAAKIAELEKNSKLAGEAGAKATAELKALKDADAEAAAKAAADKKAAEDKAKGGKTDDGKSGAPDKYEDFTLPEGMEPVQGETMDKFKAFAKEKNLSQKDAQALVDMQTGLMQQVAKDSLAAWNKDFQTMRAGWLTKAKADPEIGGTKYDETVADSKAFIKAFNPSKEFQQMLIMTGVGDHPEFMRLTAKAGKALKDDALHGAERKTATQGESLFPKSAPRTAKTA